MTCADPRSNGTRMHFNLDMLFVGGSVAGLQLNIEAGLLGLGFRV